MSFLDRFRKRKPTAQQLRRLTGIRNFQQRRSLLLAIEKGEEIPDFAWTPLSEAINPAAVGRDLLDKEEALIHRAKSEGTTLEAMIVADPDGAAAAMFGDEQKFQETASKARVMSQAQEKLSKEILGCLYKMMMIDDRWSVWEENGFSWWAHRFRQKVWTEPIFHPQAGIPLVRVHAETDFMCNVPDTDDSQLRIDALNKYATLNAFVWDRQEARVFSHCAHYISEENIESHRTFIAAAVSLQVADVHAKAAQEDTFKQLFHADADTSHHPEAGPRSDVDDVLNVIDSMLVPHGRQPPPMIKQDLAQFATGSLLPGFKIETIECGLQVQIPVDSGADQTSNLQITTASRHPQLGCGLLLHLRVQLPAIFDRATSILASALNLTEALKHRTRRYTDYAAMSEAQREQNDAILPTSHSYGAWCSDHPKPGLAFVTFVPAAAYKQGLLQMLVVGLELHRPRWCLNQVKTYLPL